MISVIIVGINQWQEFTKPLLCDLQDWGKGCEVIVIDNASDEPYPEQNWYKVIRTERLCYSAAINVGVRASTGDWIFSINNDVSIYDDFIKAVEANTPDKIYARQIITEAGHTWFGNWNVVIPRQVWEAVGEFDEGFRVCGFEDADYSMRAAKMGIKTAPIELPILHHWGKTRWDIPGYPATREENIRYFASKHGWTPGSAMTVIHD